MGRPRLQLDEKQIREMAQIQCTVAEIAAVMGCSIDTINDRYSHIVKEGREQGKMSLRRAQFKKALEGNPAMLIFLGKHYLNQKDQIQLTTTEPEVRSLLKRWEDQIEMEKNAGIAQWHDRKYSWANTGDEVKLPE